MGLVIINGQKSSSSFSDGGLPILVFSLCNNKLPQILCLPLFDIFDCTLVLVGDTMELESLICFLLTYFQVPLYHETVFLWTSNTGFILVFLHQLLI